VATADLSRAAHSRLSIMNRLGTTLQHLFNVRVTKVAGFLRPTSPWL
jgi:hypothetical protein